MFANTFAGAIGRIGELAARTQSRIISLLREFHKIPSNFSDWRQKDPPRVFSTLSAGS
jgi:hypothetical protein